MENVGRRTWGGEPGGGKRRVEKWDGKRGVENMGWETWDGERRTENVGGVRRVEKVG